MENKNNICIIQQRKKTWCNYVMKNKGKKRKQIYHFKST